MALSHVSKEKGSSLSLPNLFFFFFFTTYHSYYLYPKEDIEVARRSIDFAWLNVWREWRTLDTFPRPARNNFLPAFVSSPPHMRSLSIKLWDSIICEPLPCNSRNTREAVDPLLECPGFVDFIFQSPRRRKLRPQVPASAWIKEVTRGVHGIEKGESRSPSVCHLRIIVYFSFP